VLLAQVLHDLPPDAAFGIFTLYFNRLPQYLNATYRSASTPRQRRERRDENLRSLPRIPAGRASHDVGGRSAEKKVDRRTTIVSHQWAIEV
jgi:hypothetical protein